jgi:hypothetical protein
MGEHRSANAKGSAGAAGAVEAETPTAPKLIEVKAVDDPQSE